MYIIHVEFCIMHICILMMSFLCHCNFSPSAHVHCQFSSCSFMSTFSLSVS